MAKIRIDISNAVFDILFSQVDAAKKKIQMLRLYFEYDPSSFALTHNKKLTLQSNHPIAIAMK